MNRIRLNDGTEYPVEFCGLSDNVVGFRIAAPGTIADLAPIFGDSKKTDKITYLLDNTLVPDQPIVAAVYEGYTRHIGLLIDRYNGHVTIQLQKEA